MIKAALSFENVKNSHTDFTDVLKNKWTETNSTQSTWKKKGARNSVTLNIREMSGGEERYRWAESKPRGRLWPRAFDGYFIPELSLNPKMFSEANAAGGCGSTWLRTRCRRQSLWPAARGASGAHLEGERGRSSLFSPPWHSQHSAKQRKCWRKNRSYGALEKGSWIN